MLRGKKIVLGVTGSIAIYKAPEIIRNLKTMGADVHVLMSRGALEFMSPLIFQTLSENRVLTTPYSMGSGSIDHIEVSRNASAFLIAPATADIIGKISSGTADDIITCSLLAFEGTPILAPAMNRKMWKNPIVQENVKKLKSMGAIIVPPASGYLACGEEGEGRLAEIDSIILEVLRYVHQGILREKRILITGGATREHLDPVRFLTNGSTGTMGVELARACYVLGAEKVFLLTGPVHPPVPSPIPFEEVESAEDMLESVKKHIPEYDVLIMSAAIADYKPLVREKKKIKKEKEEFVLKLVRTPDVLTSVGNMKGDKIFVGFSAETENLIENSLKKLKSKGVDFIVANEVPSSFGKTSITAYLLHRDGRYEKINSPNKFLFSLELLNKIFTRESEPLT